MQRRAAHMIFAGFLLSYGAALRCIVTFWERLRAHSAFGEDGALSQALEELLEIEFAGYISDRREGLAQPGINRLSGTFEGVRSPAGTRGVQLTKPESLLLRATREAPADVTEEANGFQVERVKPEGSL